MKRSVLKRVISNGLKLGVAGGLIWWMVDSGTLDFSLMKSIGLSSAAIWLFALMFLLLFVNNFRWYVLLRGQRFNIGLWESFKLSLIGLFFNFSMPGGVGGDIIKGYYLLRDQPQRKMAAGTTILMDRLVGFFGMVSVAALSVVFSWDLIVSNVELASTAIGIGVLFLCFLMGFAFAFSRRMARNNILLRILDRVPGGRFVDRFLLTMHTYRSCKNHFFIAIGVTFLSQIIFISFFIATGKALGFDSVPMSLYFFAVPIGLIATALPISPAGIGVGQAVFLFLFNIGLGKETSLGPTIMTTAQLLMLVYGLIGAIFYFTRGKTELPDAR